MYTLTAPYSCDVVYGYLTKTARFGTRQVRYYADRHPIGILRATARANPIGTRKASDSHPKGPIGPLEKEKLKSGIVDPCSARVRRALHGSTITGALQILVFPFPAGLSDLSDGYRTPFGCLSGLHVQQRAKCLSDTYRHNSGPIGYQTWRFTRFWLQVHYNTTSHEYSECLL